MLEPPKPRRLWVPIADSLGDLSRPTTSPAILKSSWARAWVPPAGRRNEWRTDFLQGLLDLACALICLTVLAPATQ